MTDLLCEAVKITTDLNRQLEGGQTKREHLERIEKQTGKQQIPDFEIPLEGEHIWNWFWDLSNRRSGGFGLSLIPYSEFESWLRVRKPLIYDWELEIITKMDNAFLGAHQEGKQEKKDEGKSTSTMKRTK